MSLVPRDKIHDVLDRTNIAEIVKRHVELKRAGTGSWMGLCPFHGEKTPSFHVNEARRYFYCFGCHEKGDAITFLTKIEQRPFMDVLQDLAAAAGVDLDLRPLSPAERQARQKAESERDRMFRAMELAAAFFEDQYASPAGAAARGYVEKRGIGQAVRERFRVGYAPSRWDALSSTLAAHKIPPSDLERLGLVGVNERGRYDFFRDRVMLPVIDRQKRVIGFGGRLLDPDAKDRKYVNSPESPLFHKKESLYGLHAALDAIRRSGTAIIVEGNFDVLALHQAGIEEVVAPMGTALTEEQIDVVKRVARTIVVVFDGDSAGQRAAQKAIPLFVDAGVADARIARLPAGVDPDDFVRDPARGADAFRRLVESARPMLDQFIQDAASDANVPDRVSALRAITALLVKVKDQTTREIYAGQLAGILKMEPQQVRRAMQEASAAAQRPARNPESTPPSASQPAPVTGPAVRLPGEELELLSVLAGYPELLRSPEAARAGDLLVHPLARQLYRAAAEQAAAGALDIPSWLETVATADRATIVSSLKDERFAKLTDPAGYLRKLVIRLEILRVDAEIAMNTRLQKEAQTRGDDAALQAHAVRGIELRKTKEGLRAALQRP
ncbi:MAG TPA: DNA primase [Polyangia bacterium]|nr:DNA primase [Polyangia bacterium]